MKVKDFLDTRKPTSLKRIRIIELDTHKSLGSWWENDNAERTVKSIKATVNIIFVFV